MDCSFDVNKCSPECKKYSLCSFLEVQRQIANMNLQLNAILKTTAALATTISTLKNQNTETEEKLVNYTTELLKLINNSQPISFKEDNTI